jgi:hypothetical protein
MRRLAGKSEPWIVTLNPTPDTLKKLKARDYVLTKTRDGSRTLAQARSAKTGALAENIDIGDAALPGKGPSAAKVAAGGAAVAWQAMAIATQQHYLVEISGKLSGIEAGIEEIITRQLQDKTADLETTMDHLDLIDVHLAAGDQLDGHDRQIVTDGHRRAMQIHKSAVEHLTTVLNDASQDPVEAVADLALAERAAAVAARCASTLLRLPFETEDKRLNAFWHYSDKTAASVEAVKQAAQRLNTKRVTNDVAWDRYLAAQPTAAHKRLWNATGGKVDKVRLGRKKPAFDGLYRLSDAEKDWIRLRAARRSALPALETVTVIIDESGARLLPSP